MIRDGAQHMDAAFERARLATLAAHEQQIRELERARAERRMWPFLNTSSRPSDDWEGATE